MPEERKGLCYRCENRARFYETGHAPRVQCGIIDRASHSCYAYRPVKPCITKASDPNDPRPRFAGALFSAREQYNGIAPFEHCDLIRTEGGVVTFWVPENEFSHLLKAKVISYFYRVIVFFPMLYYKLSYKIYILFHKNDEW